MSLRTRIARGFRARTFLLGAGAIIALALAAVAAGGGVLTAGPRPDGTAVTPNGWFIDPAGTQVQVGGRPYGLALSPDGRRLLVSNDSQGTQSLMTVDAASRSVSQSIPYVSPQALYLGVVYATGRAPMRPPAATTRSAPTTSRPTAA